MQKNLVSQTSNIESDLTQDTDYDRLVKEEIEEYSNIEVTEDLREGGIHAHDSWAYWFQFLARKWGTFLKQEIVEFCESRHNPRILSLGCGYGGVELSIADSLKRPFEMLGLDLNESILESPRAVALRKNLPIRFQVMDINFLAIAEGEFDVVMAHASLHHLLNLEHVFQQIQKGLKDDGILVVQDIIGKTQVLFWKENVEFTQELVRSLPSRLTKGVTIPPYVEPELQIGMEGIRQEEIEEQIDLLFKPVRTFHYGSFMRLICTHPVLGKRLNPDDEQDREILDHLCRLDLKQIEDGILRPTEVLGVYSKR